MTYASVLCIVYCTKSLAQVTLVMPVQWLIPHGHVTLERVLHSLLITSPPIPLHPPSITPIPSTHMHQHTHLLCWSSVP
jgi:hypothetical protein